MRVHVDRRHEQLLEAVREAGRIRVTDLAERLDVSLVTVRRDVEALASQGKLRRIHGAVMWPDEDDSAGKTDRGEPGPVIGMVVPKTQYYFGDIVRAAQAVIAGAGGRLILGITDYQSDQDEAHVQRMLDSGVDALLLSPAWSGTPDPAQERWLIELPVPVVLVERSVPAFSPAATLDRVRAAATEGSAIAVRHLEASGHQRIALLQQSGQHSAQLREGFTATIAALELWRPLGAAGFILPVHEVPDAEDILLEAHKRDGVTAAVVHNDVLAIKLLATLRGNGVRVPADFALVAYDDEVAEVAEVPLTAVAPPKREIGATAAQLVLRRIAERGTADEPAAPQHLDLVPELRIRVSSTSSSPATG